MSTAADLAGTVTSFLTREGWSLLPPDGSAVVVAQVSAPGGAWALVVVATEDERLVAYSMVPVPLVDAIAVAAFITRLNGELVLGNFDLDPADGALRFKTSVGVAGMDVSDALLRELVYPNVATVEQYLPALTGVASGRLSVDEALALTD